MFVIVHQSNGSKPNDRVDFGESRQQPVTREAEHRYLTKSAKVFTERRSRLMTSPVARHQFDSTSMTGTTKESA